MNWHLLFVHTSAIFVTAYSLLEFARFQKITHQSWYTPLKCGFLFFSTVIGIAGVAGSAFLKNAGAYDFQLIKGLFSWAELSILIFSLLSLFYILLFISKKAWFIEKIESRFEHGGTFFPAMGTTLLKMAPLGAFTGLLSLAIARSLGTAVSFGPNVNAFIQFTYHLFIK